MYKSRVLLLLICILVYAAACQSRPTSLSPVLSDNTCEPPCWANIIPGKTTDKDLEEILQNTTSVKKDSIFSRPLEGFDGIIWQFSDGTLGVVSLKNGTVWSVDFTSQINNLLDITLAQAIEKYGEPEYVFSQMNPKSTDWGAVTFIYPKKGVTFSYATHVERRKYQGVLRPETPITGISYFPPENYQEIYDRFYVKPPEWSEEVVKASIYPWDGYGIISEKYPTAFGKK